MNCNDLHKKLIFFLEAELPKKEMQEIQLHLNDCKECSLFLEDMKKTFGTIDTDKIQESNPFFYTRLKVRLENEAEPQIHFRRQPVLAKILQPVLFSVLLLAGIYGGYKIGGTETNYRSATFKTQEMIPYLNDMKSEAIETFLME